MVNYLFITTTFIAFAIIMCVLFVSIVSIFFKGIVSFRVNMLFTLPKAVGEEGGGFANALVGSMVICFGTIICFTVVGVILGILLSLYKHNKISKVVSILINSLNSIPSIVIGIIAYIILVQPFRTFNVLAAIFALGLIYLPYIVIYTEEVMTKMKILYLEQGLALGLSKFKTTIFLLMRFSKGMIVFGVLSGLARIIGESAPLLFTALGNDALFEGLTKPISALPLLIFTYAISPFEEWRSLAWAAAFVMIIIVLSINLLLNFVVKKVDRKS